MRRACIFIFAWSILGMGQNAFAAEKMSAAAAQALAEQRSIKHLLQIVAVSGYLAGAESNCNIRRALTIKTCMALVASEWSNISGTRLSHPADATSLAKKTWENALEDGQHAISGRSGCEDVDTNANNLEIFSLCRSVNQPPAGTPAPTSHSSSSSLPGDDETDQGNHVINEEMTIQ